MIAVWLPCALAAAFLFGFVVACVLGAQHTSRVERERDWYHDENQANTIALAAATAQVTYLSRQLAAAINHPVARGRLAPFPLARTSGDN